MSKAAPKGRAVVTQNEASATLISLLLAPVLGAAAILWLLLFLLEG
jgi:hypothetical protein